MKYKTGINQLDNILDGGINHHSLVYISGLKETGKSGLANLIIENIAKEQAHTGLFCLDFSAKIYINYLKAKYKDNIKNWAGYINIEDSILDILDIENKIREWYRLGTRVFSIDNILRITHDTFSGSGTATDDIYLRLEALKKELDIIIIIIVELTKMSYETEFKSLYNTEFAETRADIWLYLSSKEILVKKVEIIKNKQSNNLKTFDLNFDMEW